VRRTAWSLSSGREPNVWIERGVPEGREAHVLRDARDCRPSKTSCSCRSDAPRLYSLHPQHNPWRAAPLAWRTRSDDDGLLSALQPIDLLFEFGDPLLALRQGARRIRDPIYLGHEPLNQNLRLKKGHEYVQLLRPLHGEHFTRINAANVPGRRLGTRPHDAQALADADAPNLRREPSQVISNALFDVDRRGRRALQCVKLSNGRLDARAFPRPEKSGTRSFGRLM
jgi:hypothetical protein